MRLVEVIGQQSVKDNLMHAFSENRLSHANLLAGTEGNGALPIALAMTQFLNCENKQNNDSCGECDSCIKCGKMIHPDVHFVFPVINNPKKKADKPVSDDYAREWREHILRNPYTSLTSWLEFLDAGNKQGKISVYESAAILRKLNLKTFESKYKIVIIWLAEMMNNPAANKLLKILEEPPEGTIFFLITENEDSLLLTIRSRVQTYRLLPLADELISAALEKRNAIPQKEARRLGMIAAGNYHMATALIDQSEIRTDWEEMFMEWMRMSFSPMRDFSKLLNWIDHMASKGRTEQKAFLSFCLETARECLLVNYAGELQRFDEDQFTSLRKFAPYIHVNNAEHFVNEISTAIYGIERNANPKILFLDLSFRLSLILKPGES